MGFVNGYDVVEDRSLELRHGDFFQENLQIDVLVISAWNGFYEPESGTMIKALEDQCGLTVASLDRALDFTGSPTIRAWISDDLRTLKTPLIWRGNSRFTRLVVIESPRIDSRSGQTPSSEGGIPVFEQMFRLLALLPLHQIQCRSVATPLLNAGRQGAELSQLITGLRQAIRTGFGHVPELRQLVIFDLNQKAITDLSAALDHDLNRDDILATAVAQDGGFGLDLRQLIEQLRRLLNQPELVEKAPDLPSILGDIINPLQGEQIQLVAIAISARKLIEVLVKISTEGKGLADASLYKRINYLESSISSWIANALHGIRIFGNWLGHAEVEIGESLPTRPVRREDLAIMLQQLHCVVAAYPWPRARRLTPKPKRPLSERPTAAL